VHAGMGETNGTIKLVNRLSLAGLISTGEPSVHKSHQCRSALFRRVRVPQLSQTKTSLFMSRVCSVALSCKLGSFLFFPGCRAAELPADQAVRRESDGRLQYNTVFKNPFRY
jgi:hypothetical protein